MTGNILAYASFAGIFWGVIQHWTAGTSWNFALWSVLLLVGVTFYRRAEKYMAKSESKSTEDEDFKWTFRD